VYEWTNLTFWLDYFVFFELCLLKHHGILQFRNQKAGEMFMFKPRFRKRTGPPPWKVSLFVRHWFSQKRDNKLHLKFYIAKVVLLIYRLMPRMLDSGGWNTALRAIGISRCFGTLYCVQRSIQHRYTSSLMSFNRNTFHHAPCGIWRWVTQVSFEKLGNSS
jgi:hypothetical protein